MDNFFDDADNGENMTKTEADSIMKPTKTDLITKNEDVNRLKSVDNWSFNEIITGYSPTGCG